MFRDVQMKNTMSCENEKTSIFVFFRLIDIERRVKIERFSIICFEKFTINNVSNVVVFLFITAKSAANAINVIFTNQFFANATNATNASVRKIFY